MIRDDDLCPSSNSPIPEDGAVYCICGRVWKTGERVPLHNMKGHPQSPEKLKVKIDRAFEIMMRKRRERELREQERSDEYHIAMIEIERRKMIGRAKRGIPTMVR